MISYKDRLDMRIVLRVTKFAVIPISWLPPSAGAGLLSRIRYQFCVWSSVAFLAFWSAMGVYDSYRKRGDAMKLIQVFTEAFVLLSSMLKTLIHKKEARRLEMLMNDVEEFLNQATPEEHEVMRFWVSKFVTPHSIAIMSVTFGDLLFIVAPLLVTFKEPTTASYFEIESDFLYGFLFICQFMCVVQAGCSLIFDLLYATLLWYASARFDIMAREYKKAASADDLKECARKHQILIAYANELQASAAYGAVEVTFNVILSVTLGGFILVRNLAIVDYMQYGYFEFVSVMELLIFTTPADNLREQSMSVGEAAYGCEWFGKTHKMQTDILLVTQRAQHPVVVAVDGLLPPLSLEFFRLTIAASFSYIATLRAIVGE